VLSKTCIIVGAGIAGLTAGRVLREAGWRVRIFDKGQRPGGRMATRRFDGAVFDHGAQFFTARSEEFGAEVERWQRQGFAVEWCRGFSGDDGHPRYRGLEGMSQIPRHLAEGLDVQVSQQVTSVSRENGRWQVQGELGLQELCDAVVLTPPVPQSRQLLEAGQVDVSASVRERLAAVEYERCIAVMATLGGAAQLEGCGAVQLPPGGPIQWIADNQAKGISPGPAVTIHASAAYSAECWTLTDEQVSAQLLQGAELKVEPVQVQVHRWRFAKPAGTADPAGCAMLPNHPPLVLAGDAFGGASVEGAALSGLAAARAILAAV
jgi:hypothetical protein